MMRGPADIIARLGGADALAEHFGITRKAIDQWENPKRGIPSKRYVGLLSLAKERRVKLSLADLSTQSQRAA